MKLYPTYEWYCEEFRGLAEQETFSKSLPKAYALVKQRCCLHDLNSLSYDEEEAFMFAVCGAIDALEQPALSSYTAGKVSETFTQQEQRSNSIHAVIERYLSGTRLIEAGF